MPERLLHAISSLGEMSLDEFYSIFDAIQSQRVPDQEINLQEIRRSSIRFLDALGHCEFDFDKRKVFACPPALVRLPSSGFPSAVLAGARTPAMIRKIEEFVSDNKDYVCRFIIPQTNHQYLLPSAIIIEAINIKYLQSISQIAGLNHSLAIPASWSLANFSLGIKDIIETVSYRVRDDLNWNKEIFSVETLKFSRYCGGTTTNRLVSYINPINQQRYHLIWDGQKAAEVDRDWGRYIILAKHGMQILLYDDRLHILAVPSTVPLPRFLGRSAVLCSGLTPEHMILGNNLMTGVPTGHPMDVYYSIPPSIACLIAEKLSQDLIRHKIITHENGVIA